MVEHEIIASDATIESALKTARQHDGEPLARTVAHLPELNLLIIGLSNGRRLALPIEDVQGLRSATHEQLRRFELLGRETGISFPDLDVDLYVPALIEGVYGNRRWMENLETKDASTGSRAVKVSRTKSERRRKTVTAS